MKPQNPKTRDDLERMLRAGMGRAILFLMSKDLSQYRDLILDSCLYNHAYDHQCEETRAEYLYPLIKLSGKECFYRREILGALVHAKDSPDVEQLLDFAVLFARDSYEEAREALYEKLRRNDTDHPLTGDDAVIELDGTRGLIFLLDLIGRDPLLLDRDDPLPMALVDCVTLSSNEILIESAEKKLGVEEVRLALQTAALANPNIAAALDHMPNYSPDWTADDIVRRREEIRHEMVYHGIESAEDMAWEDVKCSASFQMLVFPWGRLAPDEELMKAAADLNPLDEPERLRSHLTVFRKRPFPLDPAPLIRLVDHPDDGVVIRALTALELIRHADVRALFYRLSEHPRWSERAIGLLRSNYQQGDCELIVKLLDKETDPDRLHIMCIDTMDVYKDNPRSEGMQPLLLAYEKNPCSTCRHTCVETIETIGDLPGWMVEECLHDAYSSTRELAAEIRQGAPITPLPGD